MLPRSGEQVDNNLGGTQFKEFNKNESYEQDSRHGGLNKEQILMTVETFKKFCMKARTDKADEIHDYYVKLENLLHETLEEESYELKNRLLEKDKQINYVYLM